MFGCLSAVCAAQFRHLPSAYDIVTTPAASYQSAFTLPQVGEQSALAVRESDHGMLRRKFTLEF